MSAGKKPKLKLRASAVLGSPVHCLAFGFGAGLAPVAPGTFGTLVGIPFVLLLLPLGPAVYGVATLAMFALGCRVCGLSAQRLGVHDYGGIVFDEVVGYIIAAAPLQIDALRIPLWSGLAAAFVLFRVFDIWKPWPIRQLDRRVHGGLGIMIDDVLAGIFAAAVLALGAGLIPR